MAVLSQDDVGPGRKHFNLENGLAIRGFDPVAYFKEGKAIRGKKEISYADSGVTYYFATLSDREDFLKNPKAYEPQYGGWCAYAMGKDGSKVDVDPGTFKILNGKLFLFYNRFFNNTLKSWNEDEDRLHRQADKNWVNWIRH